MLLHSLDIVLDWLYKKTGVLLTCNIPDQKEVEMQCLFSTESVISSSAPSVQIQWSIQWQTSVYGVLVQCILFYFCNQYKIHRGKGQ